MGVIRPTSTCLDLSLWLIIWAWVAEASEEMSHVALKPSAPTVRPRGRKRPAKSGEGHEELRLDVVRVAYRGNVEMLGSGSVRSRAKLMPAVQTLRRDPQRHLKVRLPRRGLWGRPETSVPGDYLPSSSATRRCPAHR